MERRFYQMSKTELPVAAARLAEKAGAKGQKLCILTPNEERAQMIDDALWQYSEFLPHSLGEFDGVSKVNITIEDSGDAAILFLIDDKDCEVENCDLICYLFHSVDQDIVQKRRKNWSEWNKAGFHLSYFAEDDQGRWIKEAEVNNSN